MAQDFSTNYPLIDGQGNFGSIDGDSAAAMRYTEAKLSNYGETLLADITKQYVPFKDNFDGHEEEPVYLATLIPNLLVNGTSGIAVGMASNIPPHNLGEIIDALNYMIEQTLKGEEYSLDGILSYVKAPDFPTGADIFLPDKKELYSTGSGKIVMQCKYHIEDTSIIITEIPYKVKKSKLIESIVNLIKQDDQKKNKDKNVLQKSISDIRDESDRNGMRIVIETKKNANMDLLINTLKNKCLRTNFNASFLVLNNGSPEVLNLVSLLEAFLSHAGEVIINRTHYLLESVLKEYKRAKGLLKFLEEYETCIDIIRDSENPVNDLMKELDIDEEVANYIADSKIRKLNKNNQEKLKEELSKKEAEKLNLESILNDNSKLLKVMKEEFTQIKDKLNKPRKSNILHQLDEIVNEDLIEDEKLVITFSTNSYIKAIEENEFKTQNRGGKGTKIKTQEDDYIKYLITASSKSDLYFFTSLGRCHRMKVYEIEKASKTSKGKPIHFYLDLLEEEKIVSIFNDTGNNDNLLFLTKNGLIKRLDFNELNTNRNSIKVINIKDDDELINVISVKTDDYILIATKNGIGLKLKIDDNIKVLGRNTSGSRGIKLNKDDIAIDLVKIEENDSIFIITEAGYGKRIDTNNIPLKNKGNKGARIHKINDKTKKLSKVLSLNEEDELLVCTQNGKIIRCKAADISKSQSTNTVGVKICNLESSNDIVVSVDSIRNED